jgi:Flp pilus assembly protein TadD
MPIQTSKRTIAATLLTFFILFCLTERGGIAGSIDWSTIAADETTATDNPLEVESSNSEASQKKAGNGFVRALGSPFRALSRLFGGGKKSNQQAKRISDKEAAKFQSTSVIRVKDGSSVPPTPSTTTSLSEGAASTTEFDTHLQKGRDLLLTGDVNGAISELAIASSIDSKSGEANKLLGIAYESKGLRDRALQSFEAALRSDANNVEHLNNFGYLLYKNGDLERATKYLKRASQISPNDPRIWNNLGLAQCERHKFDDAYKSFARAVGEFEGHVNLATQLQARGYAKEAIKHFEKAQELRPNSVDVLTRLVSLYESTGKPTDAEAARRSLVALKTFADASK